MAEKIRSDYISTYIPPRMRDEFDKNLDHIIKVTGRSKNEVCRQILSQCLKQLVADGKTRGEVTLSLNL